LDKQPANYAYKILLTSGMLALSLSLVLLTNTMWLQLLNAVYLAFVFTQIAFIGHDLGHRQIFHSARKSALLGLIVGNLTLGLSHITPIPTTTNSTPTLTSRSSPFLRNRPAASGGLRGSCSNTRPTYSSRSCCWKRSTCVSIASIS
jgi:hypothetical protein